MRRREAGALGRIPGVSEIGSQIQLLDYLVDPFAAPALSFDGTSSVKAWGMFGNAVEGCCGPCGDLHGAMSTAWLGKEQPAGNYCDSVVWPTTQQVLEAYWAWGIAHGESGPKPDQGVDLGKWLLWRLNNPIGPLTPIGGFAQVPLHGSTYRAAMQTFGHIYSGELISQEAMDEYKEGMPFTSVSTNWIGGHCTLHNYFDPKWGRLVTWGTDELFSWPWWGVCAEEAYVILTPAMMSAPGGVWNGVRVAKLAADIEALKGIL